MIHITTWFISSCVDLSANYFIGITKWNSLLNQFVDIFNTKNVFVFWVGQKICIDSHVVDGKPGNTDAIEQFLKRWQKDFFYDLKIPKISTRQIIRHHTNLVWNRLYFVAMRTDEFKNIRIFFVWHNTRSGSQFIRKRNKSEILAHEQANIESKFRDGCGNRRHGKSHCYLHLSAPHLRINHIVIHRFEPQ